MQHRASHAPVFKLHPVQLPVEPPLDRNTEFEIQLSFGAKYLDAFAQ